MSRTLMLVFISCSIWLIHCGALPSIPVLHREETGRSQTLATVWGIGPNESAAISEVMQKARGLRADAILIQETRLLGSLVQITAQALVFPLPPKPLFGPLVDSSSKTRSF
jgi:hypothetical protein